MRYHKNKYFLILAIIVSAAAWSMGAEGLLQKQFVSSAEAMVGRPATPVSYAGVARRTSVGPGVNTRYNRGGPVNRVGRR